MIMTLPQFVQYMNTGSTGALTYPATTSLDVTFHDAEGCAGYVLVLDTPGIVQDVTVYPNLTITRSPARQGTGACAQ